jgi:hypothetical protein
MVKKSKLAQLISETYLFKKIQKLTNICTSVIWDLLKNKYTDALGNTSAEREEQVQCVAGSSTKPKCCSFILPMAQVVVLWDRS